MYGFILEESILHYYNSSESRLFVKHDTTKWFKIRVAVVDVRSWRWRMYKKISKYQKDGRLTSSQHSIPMFSSNTSTKTGLFIRFLAANIKHFLLIACMKYNRATNCHFIQRQWRSSKATGKSQETATKTCRATWSACWSHHRFPWNDRWYQPGSTPIRKVQIL